MSAEQPGATALLAGSSGLLSHASQHCGLMLDQIVWEHPWIFLLAAEPDFGKYCHGTQLAGAVGSSKFVENGACAPAPAPCRDHFQRVVDLHKRCHAACARQHPRYCSADLVSLAQGQQLPTKHYRGSSICSAGL